MAFDIDLPERRLVEARGRWLDRILADDLDDALGAAPDRLAFVGANSMTGQHSRLTYRQFAARAAKIAVGLVRLGVTPCDAVAFQLPHWWEFTALVDTHLQSG